MFFVFDVETIPDFDYIRTVLKDPDDDNSEMLLQAGEELGRGNSDFLPPIYHQMVSWVGLWIDNLGSPRQKVSWHGKDEKEGLQELFNALKTYKDFGLIHHNGRGFDLPLLTYRALKHDLQMPTRLNQYEIRYRYSKENIDLIDEFSNYGASSWPKLKHLGYLINIPIKQTGEGNEVLTMYQNGQLEDIEKYCHEDVMATYIVWLHLKFTTGDIQREHFENLQDRAHTKLEEIQEGE
jgi:predicted PolB exonuclease-like 3'-5' exonuclease